MNPQAQPAHVQGTGLGAAGQQPSSQATLPHKLPHKRPLPGGQPHAQSVQLPHKTARTQTTQLQQHKWRGAGGSVGTLVNAPASGAGINVSATNKGAQRSHGSEQLLAGGNRTNSKVRTKQELQDIKARQRARDQWANAMGASQPLRRSPQSAAGQQQGRKQVSPGLAAAEPAQRHNQHRSPDAARTPASHPGRARESDVSHLTAMAPGAASERAPGNGKQSDAHVAAGVGKLSTEDTLAALGLDMPPAEQLSPTAKGEAATASADAANTAQRIAEPKPASPGVRPSATHMHSVCAGAVARTDRHQAAAASVSPTLHSARAEHVQPTPAPANSGSPAVSAPTMRKLGRAAVIRSAALMHHGPSGAAHHKADALRQHSEGSEADAAADMDVDEHNAAHVARSTAALTAVPAARSVAAIKERPAAAQAAQMPAQHAAQHDAVQAGSRAQTAVTEPQSMADTVADSAAATILVEDGADACTAAADSLHAASGGTSTANAPQVPAPGPPGDVPARPETPRQQEPASAAAPVPAADVPMPPQPDAARFPDVQFRYAVALAPEDIAARDHILEEYRKEFKKMKEQVRWLAMSA